MPSRTLLLALLAPCLLAACVNETAIPEATDTAARTASAPSGPPAAPVTAFDGIYAGRLTLNPDRTRACPPAPQEDRNITVRQGRASFLIEPSVRYTLTGAVGSSGDVRMPTTPSSSIPRMSSPSSAWAVP